MKQLVVNNILIHYHISECSDTAPYLVILPGWMRSSAEWVLLADRFSKDNNLNVLVLDFPGFGVTPRPASSYDTYDYANFVLDFLNKLGVKSCTILGHSFGGRVGILLGSTVWKRSVTKDSTIIDKVIIVDCGGLSLPSLKSRVLEALRVFKPLFNLVFPKYMTILPKAFGSSDYQHAGNMKDIFNKVVAQRLRANLSDIKVPLYVLWGDKDTVESVNLTKYIKQVCSKAVIRIVWGADHSPHLSKPESFISIVKECLC